MTDRGCNELLARAKRMSRETSDIYTRLDITGYENSVANSMRTTDARKQSGECALVRGGSRREEARRENFTVIGPASVGCRPLRIMKVRIDRNSPLPSKRVDDEPRFDQPAGYREKDGT